jgi:hypothetical protein
VNSGGITALYTPAANPNVLTAERWAPNGRQLWRHEIGASRPLSPASSPALVAFAPDGTLTIIDALSGRAVPKLRAAHEPFVGADGAVVATDRDGSPRWLYPAIKG